MPKIEVLTDVFFEKLGRKYTDVQLEEILPAAKAELDGRDDDEGVLKIELNDTNRPDLWSSAGLVRQLKQMYGGADSLPFYDFFSTEEEEFDCEGRIIEVDPALEKIRPYIAAFAVTGKNVDDAVLKDIIQNQEKLCWNFGRKRSSIAMGVYRNDLITYPVRYRAADPDTTRFVPLQMERELSLREINSEHPKGKEFGPIVAGFPLFPFLDDAEGQVLSYPPVINSTEIGAVQTGDSELFIELTGTVHDDVLLAASIVACDLADSGFTILPVKVRYPYDTRHGREVTSPYYFQKPASAELSSVNKLLGMHMTMKEAVEALRRMGIFAVADDSTLYVTVPEYRNDFLHQVDVIEDIMIGYGMERFAPVMPDSFTFGRLTQAEEFSRKVKDLMIGLGFQEMMYNYLGSYKDYIARMRVTGEEYIRIANPMTENYEYVRASVLPSLMQSESASGNAVYPHMIFEVGKTAFKDEHDVSGTVTRNTLGFLSADSTVGFNDISGTLSALLYYLNIEYRLEEIEDPRFIPGRSAAVFCSGIRAGVMGEVHPAVLENWGVQMPCALCELDLDTLRESAASA
jgi:phenylalanyl-tRNA synthetase beta chain